MTVKEALARSRNYTAVFREIHKETKDVREWRKVGEDDWKLDAHVYVTSMGELVLNGFLPRNMDKIEASERSFVDSVDIESVAPPCLGENINPPPKPVSIIDHGEDFKEAPCPSENEPRHVGMVPTTVDSSCKDKGGFPHHARISLKRVAPLLTGGMESDGTVYGVGNRSILTPSVEPSAFFSPRTFGKSLPCGPQDIEDFLLIPSRRDEEQRVNDYIEGAMPIHRSPTSPYVSRFILSGLVPPNDAFAPVPRDRDQSPLRRNELIASLYRDRARGLSYTPPGISDSGGLPPLHPKMVRFFPHLAADLRFISLLRRPLRVLFLNPPLSDSELVHIWTIRNSEVRIYYDPPAFSPPFIPGMTLIKDISNETPMSYDVVCDYSDGTKIDPGEFYWLLTPLGDYYGSYRLPHLLDGVNRLERVMDNDLGGVSTWYGPSDLLQWHNTLGGIPFSIDPKNRRILSQHKACPCPPPPPPELRREPPAMVLLSPSPHSKYSGGFKMRLTDPNFVNPGAFWEWTPSTRGVPCVIEVNGTHHNVSAGWAGAGRQFMLLSGSSVRVPLTIYGRIHSDGTVSLVDVSFHDGTPGAFWARLVKFAFYQTMFRSLTYVDIPQYYRVPHASVEKRQIMLVRRYGPPPPMACAMVTYVEDE